MTEFPVAYAHRPDLSIVIPNQNNDMHNGSDPDKIQTGDAWVENYLKGYIDWARSHNSLFILTFDEDNFSPVNHIPCLFVGEMVSAGDYYLNGYTHYDLLRTLEDMFTLPHSGNAAFAIPIEEIWVQPLPTAIDENTMPSLSSIVYPNPVTDESKLVINAPEDMSTGRVSIVIYDIAGRKKTEESVLLYPGRNSYALRKENLISGIYIYEVLNDRKVFGTGKIIVD
jgi:hypothetical protein